MMTKFRTDAPNADIDWVSLLKVVARAQSFSEMRDPIYASGVLRTGYLERVQSDVVIEEDAPRADLDGLRDLLTWIVRRDRFNAGVGTGAYWDGQIDAIFDEMGGRVRSPYPLPPAEYILPRRTAPCPTCSDTARVQLVIYGMPQTPPDGFDESRFHIAGCLTDGSEPSWHCPSCGVSYDHPGFTVDYDSLARL